MLSEKGEDLKCGLGRPSKRIIAVGHKVDARPFIQGQVRVIQQREQVQCQAGVVVHCSDLLAGQSSVKVFATQD